MAAQMRPVNEWFDAQLEAQKPDTITCKASCSACCRQLTTLTIAEAAAIYAKHRDLVESLIPRLEEENAAIDDALARLGFDPQTVGLDQALHALRDEWWRLQRPCVLLKDGLCSVYEVRPMSCRSYFSRDEPERCADPAPREIAVWIPAIAWQAVAKAIELSRHGDGFDYGALPVVLRYARNAMR